MNDGDIVFDKADKEMIEEKIGEALGLEKAAQKAVETLHHGLQNARFDNITGYAMWVEEDYCSPPLAMERESVLTDIFDNITVECLKFEDEGWNKIEDKPLLWKYNR